MGGFDIDYDADVLQFAAKPQFRDFQARVITAIDKAFREGKRIVVCQAPTGSGKSIKGVTVAQKYTAYYLTTQNILLDQYSEDFPDRVALVKGRSNYCCGVTGEAADVAPCVTYGKGARLYCNLDEKGKEVSGTTVKCEYAAAIARARESRIALFNYHSFHLHRSFEQRDMLVIDEGHNVEGWAMQQVEVNLRSGEVPNLVLIPGETLAQVAAKFDPRPRDGTKDPVPTQEVGGEQAPKPEREDDGVLDSPEETEFQTGREAVGEYYEALRAAFVLAREASKKKQGLEAAQAMRKAVQLKNLLVKLAAIWALHNRGKLENEWVHDWAVDAGVGARQVKLTMKPVRVGKWVAKKLLSRGKRVLVLSATILDIATYLATIGADPKETGFIQVPSTFPVENRLIHYVPVADLSYKAGERDYPALMDAVGTVMDVFHDQRGIIHTHSDKLLKQVDMRLGGRYGDRLLVQSKEERREALLARHEQSTNGVLVAPAMHEGLDLKDDLGRWQVMLKVPYPSMGDPQIKARMAIDREWYGWLTSLKTVQTYGRIVRSAVDYGDTVVLDAGFGDFVKRNKARLPDWFRDAIRTYSSVAELKRALQASRERRSQ